MQGDLYYRRTPFAGQVCSVDGWHIHTKISEFGMVADEFGGISGCPAFVVGFGKPIKMAGFATSVVLGDYLNFTHAACLEDNGTISKTRFSV